MGCGGIVGCERKKDDEARSSALKRTLSDAT